MILFAIEGPDRYELLINTILLAAEFDPENVEQYESLIDELNQSLTNRVGIQAGGNPVCGENSEGPRMVRSSQQGAQGKQLDTPASEGAIPGVPKKLDSGRYSPFHYQVPGQPSRYDYRRGASGR